MSYGIEWNGGLLFLGAALLLLLVPGFALIAVVVVALAAVAALVALAGAIIASPYLLVRTLRRRHAARQREDEDSLPEARPTAGALTALAN
jgi:Flp pilus assembly protein TadB